MTRKDLEIIADVLHNNNQKGIFTINDLTNDFIDVLSKENPRFNKEIFISRVNNGK